MKTSTFTLTVACLALSPVTNSLAQQVYAGKSVTYLQGFYDGADCIYFRLEGVAQADPVNPNNSLFAISGTQPNAKNGYAMLLSAKLTGQKVRVTTREFGMRVCRRQ